MKNKLIKFLSAILCTSITMHMGLALTNLETKADDVAYDERNRGELTVDGSKYTFGAFGTYAAVFEITKSGNRYHIQCTSYPTDETDVYTDSITGIATGGNVQVNINADVNASLRADEYSTAAIGEGYTYNCTSLTGNLGTVSVRGTLKFDSFNSANYSSDYTKVAINNYGTVAAENVAITSLDNLNLIEGSTLSVGSSFVNETGRDLASTVLVSDGNVLINSTGGSFTLSDGSFSKTVSGNIYEQAGNILYEDTTISLSSMPESAKTVYVGQDYDFAQYAVVSPSTYSGTPYIEYNEVVPADSTAFAPDKHTTPGDYRARAVAPIAPGFRSSVSEPIDYTIKYLPETEVSTTKNYYTLEGIVNGVYVPGEVTVVPANGFKIKSNVGSVTGFADSVSLGEDDIYDERGNINLVGFAFKRNSDGAETEFISSNTSAVSPKFNNLIFDNYDPSIYGEMIMMTNDDGQELGLETSIEDGRTIVGDKLVFSVYDDNLSKVVVDGNTYTETNFVEGSIEITLSVAIGTAKTYNLVATDKAGRELNVSFTLQHSTVDPSVASVTQNDVYVGDEYEPKVTTDSDGDITFYYRDNSSEDEEDYDEAQPTAAGDYTVLAVISETDFYYETSCSTTFKIKKRTPESSVYVPDTIIGEEYEPEFTSDSDGKGRVVFEYKPSNATDRSYTTTMPTAKGTYTVRATTPETDKYLSSVCTYTFKISVKPVTATVFVEDPYVGTKYTPVVTTDSDGASKATFEYKAANSIDGEYTTEQPTAAGTYIVRATVPETETYAKAVCTFQYNIKYLTAPANAYNMEGTAGNNDFFTSDVELTAPEGYKISSEFGGEYTEKIPYTEDLNVVYLMRTEDGALTSAVALSVRPKIDKATPTFEDSTGTLTNGSAVFVKTLTLRASDDNLASLSVNGIPVDLDAEGNIMTLSPGYGIKYFKIVAEDKAGNISIIEFTLMAEWLESRIILPDIKLPLTKGEYYNLDSGRWTVTSGSGEEDTTVYNGNLPFYVNDSGDYTFTKVS